MDLEAREAIRDLVLRYCRAIDRRDFRALAMLYAEDSVDDHGELFWGSGAEFVAWVPGILETMQVTSHQVMNHLIEVDGDYAEGEVYIQAYHLTTDSQGKPVKIIGGGRYLDQYGLEGGQWRFTHRKIVADYELRLPGAAADEELIATRSRPSDDPSDRFFRLIRRADRD